MNVLKKRLSDIGCVPCRATVFCYGDEVNARIYAVHLPITNQSGITVRILSLYGYYRKNDLIIWNFCRSARDMLSSIASRSNADSSFVKLKFRRFNS